MSFHSWFGRHQADTKTSHWQAGHFVSRCTVCGCEMIKLPGLAWQLRTKPA
jgi:hypothetical protein